MDLHVEGVNIPALSDDELASKLHSLGFPAGPIVDTTRRVYQLKLARLLRNDPSGTEDDEVEDKTPTNDLQSETVGDSSTIGYRDFAGLSFNRSTPSPFRYDELRRRPLPRSGTNWTPTSSSFRSPFTTADGLHSKLSVAPSKAAVKSSSMWMGIKIAIVVILFLFGFLVYCNMESKVTNPIPEF